MGEQIVQVLTPLLLHLLDQGLARATVSQHRDNLWTLGGELIRCRYDDDALANKQAKHALCELIEGEGGPPMRPRISESQQDSLDATCRKLCRYWRDSPTQARSDVYHVSPVGAVPAASPSCGASLHQGPGLKKLYADGAYGTCAQTLEQTHGISVEVVRHPGNRSTGTWQDPQQPLWPEVVAKGFVVQAKRWVVELTHAWNERARRLMAHHDRAAAGRARRERAGEPRRRQAWPAAA